LLFSVFVSQVQVRNVSGFMLYTRLVFVLVLFSVRLLGYARAGYPIRVHEGGRYTTRAIEDSVTERHREEEKGRETDDIGNSGLGNTTKTTPGCFTGLKARGLDGSLWQCLHLV
jgi:hypothetical protein